MTDLKINCPICNQEFPAYDQRGFRNAGFTSHHKKCLERHQQSNEPQQRDQHPSRASRFAWAVRRRLLPARPTSSANLLEGQNRVTPQSPLSASNSSSSSSSSPSSRTEISPAMTPIVPSQAAQAKQHFYSRQRHTWNHWAPRRRSRRSALDMDTTSTTVATTAATMSSSFITRSHRSLPAMNSNTDSPAFPLLTAMTTLDSTPALIIPQTDTPQLSNQTPMNSPMISGSGGDGSPFSFTSMLTSLPLESLPLQPSATISTCSSNSNSVNERNSIDMGYQRQTTHTSMDSMPTNWVRGQYPFPTADDGSLYHQQQHHQHHPQLQDQLHHGLHGPVNTNVTSHATIDDTYFHHDNNTNPIFPSAVTTVSSTSPDTLPIPLRSPENLDDDDDKPIHYCGYCQPRNGQHDPTCSLMQFIMMDIIGGNDDPSSSS